MSKSQFLSKLKARLSFLKKEERDNALKFYQEMIEDGVESGRSEEEFIAGLGDMDTIVASIATEQGYNLPAREKQKDHLRDQLWQALQYLITGIIALAVLSAIFHVVSIATSMMIQGGIRLVSASAPSPWSLLLYVGQMTFGVGMWLIVIGLLFKTPVFIKKIHERITKKVTARHQEK